MAGYVVRVAALQVESGLRATIACPPGTWLADAAARRGIEVRAWAAGRNPDHGLLRELQALDRLLDGLSPDVVHLHSSKAGLVGRLAIRGRRPTVFQPHAWSFQALGHPLADAAAGWERLAGPLADVVVAVSDDERTAGVERGVRARTATVVIPNPVDTDRFRPWVGHRSETDWVRRSLGLDDGPVALCVGRLCRQKGQDRLVAAWPSVRARVPDAQLVLVGDGPDHRRLADGCGAGVTLAGNRVDVPALLRAARVVVAPSRWEGMSLAVLEAMATARSVVATDVAGVSETVGRGAGAVVPQGGDRALARAIATRLAHPSLAEREGAIGRRLALDHHRLTTVVEDLGAAYDLAMETGPVTGSRRAGRGRVGPADG